jgi:hypothetical protein
MITYIVPEKYNNYNAEVSRWASIRQPYIFTFFRKDATYSVVQNNSNKVRVTTLTLNGYVPVIGEIVTLVDNATGKKRVGKITNYAGGNIDTDIDWNGGVFTGAGYINFQKRENYKIELEVTGTIPSLQETLSLGVMKGTPDGYGICKIDVRQLLTYGCEKINKFDYDTTVATINAPDYSGYITFSVKYGDSYIYNSIEETTIRDASIPGDFWGIDGVKQNLSVYGQNYCDYLPNVATGYPAKFLTCFKRPVLFLGEPYPYGSVSPVTYPFSLQTIFRDEWRGTDPYLFTDEMLPDGTFPQQVATQLSLSTMQVHHIMLSANLFQATDSILMNVWIQTQLAGGMMNTPNGYFQDVFPEQKEYPLEVPQFACTEVKQVLINRTCKQYPIYLMWKNSVGGWDYWLFDKVNETNITAQQGERYDVYVEDLETAQFSNKIIKATGVKSITVGDVIDIEHMEGLSEIERSAAVFMLYDRRKLSTANPELAWIGVQIAPKGIKYKSNSTNATVELTIILPEYYTTPN